MTGMNYGWIKALRISKTIIRNTWGAIWSMPYYHKKTAVESSLTESIFTNNKIATPSKGR